MSCEAAIAMCHLDAVASADTRRAVRVEPSAHPRGGLRASVPGLAVPGTAGTLCGSIWTSRLQLPASLPSGWFCSPPLSPQRGSGTMKALTLPGSPAPTGLLAYLALPSRHSDPNHAGCPMVAFPVASAPPVAFRLHHERAGSPQLHAESGSSSYGLPVHLRLLPTPPQGDAVTFDFGACDRPRHGLAPCRQSALTRRTRSRASGNPGLQVFERSP